MTIRYRYTLLRAGTFRLDAGSMFGLIPRVVWQRSLPASMLDDRGRVTLQHNCLLLERLDDPVAASAPADAAPSSMREAPKLLLLEVGTGDKLDDASRDIFALERRSIVDALGEVNCRPQDVSGVVLSHLHFDHAGAITRLALPGESPDWTGAASSFGAKRADHAVKLTFPNASVVSQRREWDDALANRSVMTRTYFTDHLAPMAASLGERLVLVASPPPFAPGLTPDKGDEPGAAHAQRETEVYPGVFVFQVPGHTWGQQATRFVGPDGRSVVFTPDVMPTAWHVGQAYSLAYDVEPYTSMITRTWFLATAAREGWVLCLDHEPGHPFKTVHANGKGWYELRDA